ncbi:uncharacterized protein LOC141605551 [Silene latifolia]|uniref:uncharacterized protein LOC141605551 n=1 Tax=Silene latifolia TaxID=37657 RepID=UPI003D78A0AC
MENSENFSDGTGNGMKSELLDVQSHDDRPWVSAVKKRSSRSGGSMKNGVKRKLDSEGVDVVSKKSRKEVLLTSLLSARTNKKSASKVGKEVGPDENDGKGGGDDGGLGGISLKLNGGVNIPKRPRDLVRRKKVEVDFASNPEGVSGSIASLGDGLGKWNGDTNGSLHCNSNGKLPQNGESCGAFSNGVIGKVKRKRHSVDHKVSNCDLAVQHSKRENSRSSVHNSDSLMKKAKRLRNKVKETRLAAIRASKEVKKFSNDSIRTVDEPRDDEENLEANAARMLSSRFDTSCTGFSSCGKISTGSVTNGLSVAISSNSDFDIIHPISLAESNIASTDGEAKACGSEDQKKGKNLSKNRRRFYEVLATDFDSYAVLNRRIQVFWPLDKSWYFGYVIAYDPEKKVHHVKYDDREEEWIDLQNERFKLFLLPSEVPGKVGKKRSTTQDKHSGNEKKAETSDKEQSSNYMESEPIISWLARSNIHKSASFGIKKRQKTPNESAKSSLSLVCDGKSKLMVDGNISGCDADNLACVSAVPNNSHVSMRDIKLRDHKVLSKNKRSPIVYFRRRFQKRGEQLSNIHVPDSWQSSEELPVCETASELIDFADFGLDMLLSMVKSDDCYKNLGSHESIWDIDGSGCLKLTILVTSLKAFSCELDLPVPFVGDKLFGGPFFMFMHQHGAVISLSRMVCLEILFVDNTVGLRFLLFEGCLMHAVSFVFLILVVFQSNQKESYAGQQLPVTSIRFQFSGLRSLTKQLVFTFHYFTGVVSSKWSYLDRKLSKHCILTKELPPLECTYGNILALLNGHQKPLIFMPPNHTFFTNIQGRPRLQTLSKSCKQSSVAKLSHVTSDSDEKLGPSALSFATTPKLLNSLHLKLLMERRISSSSFWEDDLISLTDRSEDNWEVVGADRHVAKENIGDNVLSANIEVTTDNQLSSVGPEIGCCPKANMTIEIPSLISNESVAGTEVGNVQHPADSAVGINDDAMHSPCSTQLSFHSCRNGDFSPSTSACLSPGWSNRKQDFLHNGLGNGPKKPRTQVSYSMPLGGNDSSYKNLLHHEKGFSHKRIRRTKEKKSSETNASSKRNMPMLTCDGNCLVTVGDRGWRECGARVALELVDHHEWRLVVKISGETKYSYKAHQFLQPGTTNRYTHAMMWKGGKDWILEFTDRTQWVIFKEMHEECCNRNLRAASVKNIPIPGVRLIEENDDFVPEVPYLRPSSKYHRQLDADVDIAMNPSCVLYDMDSDDEQWLLKHRGLDFNEHGCGDVSDQMFEKTIDGFEKLAYAKQCDHFSLDELEDAMTGFGPFNVVLNMYEYWREKRQRKGMPLIRHLQPPLWEKYQQQLKEWEQVVSLPSGGSSEKPMAIEKPAMFAFCLKPRGLEVPNRGSKHRPQKKLPTSYLSNGVPGCIEYCHSPVARRSNGFSLGDDRASYSAYNEGTSDYSPVLQRSTGLFSPRNAGVSMGHFSLNNDGFERNYYSKPYKIKSKKLCLIPPSNDQFPSYNPRNMGKSNSGHIWTTCSSEWPSQMNNFDQVSPSELDEFRLRDAASAARHAVTVARLKRENAQRMLCRADLAMQKAKAAIVTAEAVKASYVDPDDDFLSNQ